MRWRRHRSASLVARPKPRRWRLAKPDPLRKLRRLAAARQVTQWLLPVIWLMLACSFGLMLVSSVDTPGIVMGMFALSGLLMQLFCDGPNTTRTRRIVRDRRSVLRRRVLLVPPPRRAVKLIAARAAPIILSLPPNRPRSRALPRRTSTYTEDFE
jgi:hypothetical protein